VVVRLTEPDEFLALLEQSFHHSGAANLVEAVLLNSQQVFYLSPKNPLALLEQSLHHSVLVPPNPANTLPPMPESAVEQVRESLEAIYRAESGRILATLIRLLGDFDLAEDAMQDAFAAALERWPQDGMPVNPRAWFISTARFRAIDVLRRRARFDDSQKAVAEQLETGAGYVAAEANEGVEDDRLRLVFTCCHPALGPEACAALTLREVCGLTTEEIASAFLTTVKAGPFEIRPAADLTEMIRESEERRTGAKTKSK
jgi:RNA polymerase sigma factor (sigma-70 family)